MCSWLLLLFARSIYPKVLLHFKLQPHFSVVSFSMKFFPLKWTDSIIIIRLYLLDGIQFIKLSAHRLPFKLIWHINYINGHFMIQCYFSSVGTRLNCLLFSWDPWEPLRLFFILSSSSKISTICEIVYETWGSVQKSLFSYFNLDGKTNNVEISCGAINFEMSTVYVV